MSETRPIRSVLIANRGEIAVRIARTLGEMKIRAVAVASDPDLTALHALVCDQVVPIGGATPLESYLDPDKILKAARFAGVDAVHPGYGFLAENATFARAVEEAGLVWIGPPASAIELMGDKLAAREAVVPVGVPVIPGSPAISDAGIAAQTAQEIGYPIMIKAAAGGGGKGMRVVSTAQELGSALEAARRESQTAFGSDAVFIEKYIERPRHIEFQILSDMHGHTVHLFERECSIQRRHQKIVEETPSVALDDDLRSRMGRAATQAARAASYVSAGTVEFVLGQDRQFYFLEMNTRLQVEHPITEMTCGLDLVRLQIDVARGEPLPFEQADIDRHGHAIECRVYAEDPAMQFFPSSGPITALVEPSGPGIRNDSGLYQGTEVTTYYDPMLSKLVVHAPDRPAAIARMVRALRGYLVAGVCTSIPFLAELLEHPAFLEGDTCTDFIALHMSDWKPSQRQKAQAALLAALAGPAAATGGAGGMAGRAVTQFDIWREIGRGGS